MRKRLTRFLAGTLALGVWMSALNLPAYAVAPDALPDPQEPAAYSLTLQIEEVEGPSETDDSSEAAIDTETSTETTTSTDPETGDVTTKTTTETTWEGTDEDGLTVEGSGTKTESVTTGTETTEGPLPGQTTTTTTTETTWDETSQETGEGKTDTPDAGTEIGKETETTVTGEESKTDSVTADAQGRPVEESGSAKGSETTTIVTTDERVHTEDVSAETKVEEGKPTVTKQEEHTDVKEDSKNTTTLPSETLDVDGNYAGTEVTLRPGDEDKTVTIPVDTSKYEPAIEEGVVKKKDGEDNVTSITTTAKTVGDDGKTTGYTVTTTYPDKPGETVTETVTYKRDDKGNYVGYTSKTVVSKPYLTETKEEVEETKHTGPTTVKDDEQPEQKEPEEVTIILVPEKPAESETKDAEGNTTKVTVENLYDTDGKTVIGYQVKTTVTDAKGTQVSTASESVWGTRTTVTTEAVTTYTTTEKKTEHVTTITTEQFSQAVTEKGVTITATPGSLTASMGAVQGNVVVDYETLATLLPKLTNNKSGTTNEDTDLYNRPDATNNGKPYTYDPNGGYFQWLGEDGIESAFRVYTPPEGSNGEVTTWQAHQFVLKGPDDKSYYVYCTDFEVSPKPTADYDVIRMEDAEYYQGSDEEHIRAIALNGYWGTAAGSDPDNPNLGSLEAFKKMLSEADIKDEQGNALDIDSITPGMALTATQAAIWYYGNSGDRKLNDKYITGQYYNGGNSFTAATGQEARTINAIYGYLIGLKEEATTDNTLIDEDDFAQEVKIKLNGKVNTDTLNTSGPSSEQQTDKYSADLTFTMALNVVPDKLDGSLVVQVVQVDSEGNIVKVLGDGLLNGGTSESLQHNNVKYNEDNTYTFSNLELESGAKLQLKLDGTQNLQEGVYLFRASGGYKESQTFIGVGDVKQEVNLNVELEFNVTDPVATQTTETKAYDQLYETITTAEFDRKTTVTVKSAEVTVTQETTDELHREWENEYKRTYTYDEPSTPENPDKPDQPEKPVIPVVPVIPVIPVTPEVPAEVEEISVKPELPAATPQATLPQTGQNWAAAWLLGALGVLLTSAGVVSAKRRKDEHEA